VGIMSAGTRHSAIDSFVLERAASWYLDLYEGILDGA
jgi:hypothetical protein